MFTLTQNVGEAITEKKLLLGKGHKVPFLCCNKWQLTSPFPQCIFGMIFRLVSMSVQNLKYLMLLHLQGLAISVHQMELCLRERTWWLQWPDIFGQDCNKTRIGRQSPENWTVWNRSCLVFNKLNLLWSGFYEFNFLFSLWCGFGCYSSGGQLGKTNVLLSL